jgi:tRNA G18 (ribose-2'-O)-methylase SpoU
VIQLNFNNVEDFVFYDSDLCRKIPGIRPYYEQWKMSKMSSQLRILGTKAILDFLKEMTQEQQEIIERHLNMKFNIQRPDYNMINNISCEIDNLEELLNEKNPYGYVRVYRENNTAYLTIWR